MGKSTINMTACALAGLAALAGALAHAQEDRWFRVEVLVFANRSTTAPVGAALAEQWEATPTLAYPPASRFLVDPERIARSQAEIHGDGLVDEYGRHIITILREPEDPNSPQDPNRPVVDDLATAVTAATDQPAPTDITTERAPQPLTPVFSEPVPTADPTALPRPFVLLPGDYRELAGKAALMQRGGRYSVLFHESWVQPVAPEETSLPIVLDHSGDDQVWPPLQGSIRIFLSRYLQLETNLWLNTAGEYLPGTWQMPPPPLGPPSLVIEVVEPVDLAAAIASATTTQDATAMAGGSAATTEGAAAPAGAAAETDQGPAAMAGASAATARDSAAAPLAVQAETAVQTQAGSAADPASAAIGSLPYTIPAPGGASAGFDPLELLELIELEELLALAEPGPPEYPFRHAVLLQQSRRMRSTEVHYIDHPLMGLVIKFTPVTAGELAAIAELQADSLEQGLREEGLPEEGLPEEGLPEESSPAASQLP